MPVAKLSKAKQIFLLLDFEKIDQNKEWTSRTTTKIMRLCKSRHELIPLNAHATFEQSVVLGGGTYTYVLPNFGYIFNVEI